jgi:1-pyrroline-5-carboxylate dehydrogenase
MSNSIPQVPFPLNEPILSYASDSSEKNEVLKMYNSMYNKTIEIPMRIGSMNVKTGDLASMSPPHDHNQLLGNYHKATKKILKMQYVLHLKLELLGLKCHGNLELPYF